MGVVLRNRRSDGLELIPCTLFCNCIRDSVNSSLWLHTLASSMDHLSFVTAAGQLREVNILICEGSSSSFEQHYRDASRKSEDALSCDARGARKRVSLQYGRGR